MVLKVAQAGTPVITELRLPVDPVRLQQQNKAAWNQERSFEGADFYTIGYTGRKRAEFLQAIAGAAVATVVDVRANPVSRYRPEFSKRNLGRFLEESGFRYVHEPLLGVPRDIRALGVERGSRNPIWDWYDSNVIEAGLGGNLHWFLNALDHPVALMCVEADPLSCHRHRLTLALEQKRLRGFDL